MFFVFLIAGKRGAVFLLGVVSPIWAVRLDTVESVVCGAKFVGFDQEWSG